MAEKHHIETYLSEEEVNAKIREVGEKISRDYEGKQIHLICVLKGGTFFMCELAKRITVPVTMEFRSVYSYGDGTESSGRVKIIKDLDDSIEGKEVLNMVQYRDVMRFNQICGRLSKEVNRFQEIIRFHQVRNEMFNSDIYVAHISPKSNLVLALGPIFMDRMPSEYFMIVDDVYREAVVHPKNKDCYLIKLNDAFVRF